MEQKNKLDFVERTLKIVNEYEGPFDVTLLANCTLGLLFVAKEKYGGVLSRAQSQRVLEEWGINIEDIIVCKAYNRKTKDLQDEPKTITAISRHIRNSFAHCNFEWINEDGKIKGIHIVDKFFKKDTPTEISFDMEMSLSNLQLFLKAVASFVLTTKRKPKL